MFCVGVQSIIYDCTLFFSLKNNFIRISGSYFDWENKILFRTIKRYNDNSTLNHREKVFW